jgi:hypothetical protein
LLWTVPAYCVALWVEPVFKLTPYEIAILFAPVVFD